MGFLIRLTLGVLRPTALLLSVVTAVFAQNAADLLAKADGCATHRNWDKAAPLYGEAEAAFRKSGDTRNALYAKFGRLHRDVESGAYRAVHDEVTRDLVNP